MVIKTLLEEMWLPGRERRKEMRLAEFDEKWYLSTYPDIAAEVSAGRLESGRFHYIRYGFKEGRMPFPGATTKNPEILKVTESGAVLFGGWVKDLPHPLVGIEIDNIVSFNVLVRQRRDDVARLLNESVTGNHGVWSFVAPDSTLAGTIRDNSDQIINWVLEGQSKEQSKLSATLISDLQMRTTVLEMLALTFANGTTPAVVLKALGAGIGKEILTLNRELLRGGKEPTVSRFNSLSHRKITRSQITCLYGTPELLSLQIALFSKSIGIDETEFIFINNSPETSEYLEREAKQAARLYDASITLLHAETNLGFGAANNIGASFAGSNRLLFVNPDVLPMQPDWIVKHDEFAASDFGRIFGACLYYDDGSVMHAGMYFENDRPRDKASVVDWLRIEHYAKGFPEWVAEARKTRMVPAVTGAFISIDRSHFENLGGFDEDYIFGNYEDADLCLTSTEKNCPAWYCADIHLWHMEGKGSSARSQAQHGASQLNRWLFTQRWASKLRDDPRLTPSNPL